MRLIKSCIRILVARSGIPDAVCTRMLTLAVADAVPLGPMQGCYLDDVSLSSFVPTPLMLGLPLTNTFTANGQYTYFAVQVPAGGHLLINLNALGAQGFNELY